MAKVFITLTGTKYYHGNEFLKPGMKVKLTKEPDNEYDKEAIKVSMKGIGDIGHVANSSYTVIGDSMSAGRLYDKIGDKATAKVVLVTPHGTICKVSKKSLINWQVAPEAKTVASDYDGEEENRGIGNYKEEQIMLGKDGRFYDEDFDFDGDGKLDAYEYAVMDDMVFGHGEDVDEDDELVDDLTAAGLDALELEYMDADERREALEDAGLDPDDYDFD